MGPCLDLLMFINVVFLLLNLKEKLTLSVCFKVPNQSSKLVLDAI